MATRAWKETMMSIGFFLVGIVLVVLLTLWQNRSFNAFSSESRIARLSAENVRLKTAHAQKMDIALRRICEQEGRIGELERKLKTLTEKKKNDPHDKFRPHAAR